MEQEFYHEPVLLKESTELLLHNKETSGSKIYVDGTLGGGGYSGEILKLTANDTYLISIDRDIFSIEYCKEYLKGYEGRVIFCQDNFSGIKEILNRSLKKAESKLISGIVLDLGLSSYQLNKEEGFSYQTDTPLDMRADKSQEMTAADVISSYSEKELEKMLREYGELRYTRKIAGDIIEYRKDKAIETTFDLVNAVRENIPERYLNKDLSKIFQALRIEVNGELENLRTCLNDVTDYLETGARIVVISYHSLDDRIVKNFFRSSDVLKVITKKPLGAGDEEVNKNIRARSAKLRAAEKIQ
jgi:16S rRNA (cytosine1402-N4)-methyltransferase